VLSFKLKMHQNPFDGRAEVAFNALQTSWIKVYGRGPWGRGGGRERKGRIGKRRRE